MSRILFWVLVIVIFQEKSATGRGVMQFLNMASCFGFEGTFVGKHLCGCGVREMQCEWRFHMEDEERTRKFRGGV